MHRKLVHEFNVHVAIENLSFPPGFALHIPVIILDKRSSLTMDKIKDENFENIRITSVKVQDRTLPYWINVNFTLKRTGQRLKKSKKLRVQSAVRDQILPFCREVNDSFQISREQANLQIETDEIEVDSHINANTNEEMHKDLPPSPLKRKLSVQETTNDFVAGLPPPNFQDRNSNNSNNNQAHPVWSRRSQKSRHSFL